LVETAIISIFLVTLMLGVWGFGRILTASIRLESAAREGARAAGTGASNAQIQTQALQTLSATGNVADIPGSYWMQITPSNQAQRTFNTQCTVQMWWNYPVPVPLFNVIVNQRLLYAFNVQAVTVGPPP
jgi:Flp pilus assembly protein TadG